MNKKYGIIGLILVIVLATVMISGCIGSGETETSNSNSNSDSNSDSNSNSNSDSNSNSNSGSGLKYQKEVNNILARYDYNNDGKLNVDEFGDWALDVGMDKGNYDTFAYIFVQYDTNGDGYWDKNEINRFFTQNN